MTRGKLMQEGSKHSEGSRTWQMTRKPGSSEKATEKGSDGTSCSFSKKAHPAYHSLAELCAVGAKYQWGNINYFSEFKLEEHPQTGILGVSNEQDWSLWEAWQHPPTLWMCVLSVLYSILTFSPWLRQVQRRKIYHKFCDKSVAQISRSKGCVSWELHSSR